MERDPQDDRTASPPARRWPLLALAALAGIVGIALGAAAAFALGSDDGASAGDAPLPEVGAELRQVIHEHADFALFIRGERFDFGREEFISYEGDERSPNVHIHEPRFNVLHVHREGTTWDELFRSIGFELTDTTNFGELGAETLALPSGELLQASNGETFKFYVNGVRVDGIADMNIGALDRVLVSFGPESHEEVLATQWPQVTDEACIPQGLCLDRGNGAGEHGEPCATRDGQCTGN